MKAGVFNLNEYLERLTEAVEAKEKAERGAPVTKAVGGPGEGLIIPEENKKVFAWLKKEYQKAQTEVKVEINMGGAKFEPGYDLQTNLKSVKDFKPGMFGSVKTSDNENGPKKESGTSDKSSVPDSEKNSDKNGEKEVSKKKFGKEGAKVSEVDVEEKEDKEDSKDKFKKKLKESLNEDLSKGYTIVQEGTPITDREAYAYLSDLPMTRKPNLDDLNYAKKIKVDPQLEAIMDALPVVDFDTYDNLLEDWGEDFPFTKTFFIANVLEDDGVTFLVRPDGYSYARYIAELI